MDISKSIFEQSAQLPEWVREMQEHFRDHGYYRPEDLRRVLGDPRAHVEVHSTDGTHSNVLTRSSAAA